MYQFVQIFSTQKLSSWVCFWTLPYPTHHSSSCNTFLCHQTNKGKKLGSHTYFYCHRNKRKKSVHLQPTYFYCHWTNQGKHRLHRHHTNTTLHPPGRHCLPPTPPTIHTFFINSLCCKWLVTDCVTHFLVHPDPVLFSKCTLLPTFHHLEENAIL